MAILGRQQPIPPHILGRPSAAAPPAAPSGKVPKLIAVYRRSPTQMHRAVVGGSISLADGNIGTQKPPIIVKQLPSISRRYPPRAVFRGLAVPAILPVLSRPPPPRAVAAVPQSRRSRGFWGGIPVPTTWLIIQSVQAENPSLSQTTVTLPQPTGTGNTLIALITTNGATSNPQVSSITLGGSADHWVSVAKANPAVSFGGEIWYDPNCASGQTSVVVNCTGGAGLNPEMYVSVYEVASILVTDQHASAVATSGAWSSGATPAVGFANEIYFGVTTNNVSIPVVTGAGAWTTRSTGLGTFDQASSYQPGRRTSTATFSGTPSSTSWVSVVATFTPAPPAAIANLAVTDGLVRRRTSARAVIQFRPVSTTNHLSGEQPGGVIYRRVSSRAVWRGNAVPGIRPAPVTGGLVRRRASARAFIQFTPVKTTNHLSGNQPGGIIRRRTAARAVWAATLTKTYNAVPPPPVLLRSKRAPFLLPRRGKWSWTPPAPDSVIAQGVGGSGFHGRFLPPRRGRFFYVAVQTSTNGPAGNQPGGVVYRRVSARAIWRGNAVPAVRSAAVTPPVKTVFRRTAARGVWRGNAVTFAASYRNTVLSDLPAVYYRLGDVSAPAVPDPRAGGVNALMTGTVTFGQAGALPNDLDTAVSFPGTTGNFLATVATPGASYDLGDGPWSIEFWYKATAVGVVQDTLAKGVGAYLAQLNASNQWAINLSGTGPCFTTTASFPDTTGWHYVVITRVAGTQPHIYVDSIDQAGTYAPRTFGNNTAAFNMGSGGGSTAPFSGLLDEVALYKSVLSQAQVTAHYQAAVGSNTGRGTTGSGLVFRRTAARAVWRGNAVPPRLSQSVTNGLVRRRTFARAVLQFTPVKTFNTLPPSGNQPGSGLVKRRTAARAVIQFRPVSTTNGASAGPAGTVQPLATVPIPRRAQTRAYFRFRPVTTTNHLSGSQPGGVVFRRTTARAFVQFKPVKTVNHLNGNQPGGLVFRRAAARAVWRGNAVPFRQPVPVTGAGLVKRRTAARGFTQFRPVQTINHLNGNPPGGLVFRRTAARGVWGGNAVPGRRSSPVTGGLVKRRNSARAVQLGQVTRTVNVIPPSGNPPGGLVRRRTSARAFIWFKPVILNISGIPFKTIVIQTGAPGSRWRTTEGRIRWSFGSPRKSSM